MLNNLGLGILLQAKDEFSSTMDKARSKFGEADHAAEGLTSRFSTMTKVVALGAAAVAAAAVGIYGSFKLAGSAGEFERNLVSVAAVSGATAKELDELRKAAIQAGIETQYSPADVTMGLRSLAQSGYTAREQLQLLTPVLDLAAGSLGELTPQGAAGLAAQTMKAFGLQTDQATLSVDRMLKTVNMFALTPGELPLALGIASRGAVTMRQSLSETLIAMGLTKNIIPTVERASTSIAVTMERMADPQVQKAMKGIGIEVVDATRNFRPFLDVMLDLSKAMETMTAAEAGAFLTGTLGARSMAGMTAITTQLSNGIRTTSGELVKGAAAVEYLRGKMQTAAGTAHEFSSRMLDTYEGQKLLLKGTLQTLAIVIGTPFAEVFAPMVKIVTDELNKLLKLLVNKEGAWGRFVEGASRAGVALRALSQLFSQGGFSGDVLKEMQKAENQGLRHFAIQAWHWAGVVGEAWRGLWEGFSGAIEALRPSFAALKSAFNDILTALHIGNASARDNASTWDMVGGVATQVGATLGWLASVLAEAVAFALRTATTLVMVYRDAWQTFGPVVKPILLFLWDALMTIGALLEGDWGVVWRRGAALVLDMVASMMTGVSKLVMFAAKSIDWLGSIFGADLGLGEAVGKGVNEALAELYRFRGELVSGVAAGAAAPWQAPILTQSPTSESIGMMSLARGGQSVAPAAVMASYAAAGAEGTAEAASTLSALSNMAASGGSSEERIIVPVSIDGEKVGEAVAKVRRRREERAFSPMSPVTQE